jgi:two-component system, LuxR family, response regulator FixJ
MPSPDRPIYVVDDDAAVREATCALLEAAGFEPKAYASGTEFLEDVDLYGGGAALLDICMPDLTGLEVQALLAERGSNLSVIVLTGHGDIRTAVQAIKAGATDFLEKPYEPQALLGAVERGLRLSAEAGTGVRAQDARGRLARLTPRECEVLQALMAGGTNKSIARRINVSPRTIEMHRANMMERLGVRSLSEALRIAYDAGLSAP